jgi:predicted metal-dependent hydrolase
MGRPRLLPDRSFPGYAYLPGKGPHPVRDPGGHSYGVQPAVVIASLYAEEFAWGQDLFNHGYYWEAHEAWEGIWQNANRGSPLRAFLKGLILLCATGVKIREAKRAPAVRHARRAGALLRDLTTAPHDHFSRALGISLELLADLAEATAEAMPEPPMTTPGRPKPVFDFVLGDVQMFADGLSRFHAQRHPLGRCDRNHGAAKD